LFRVGALLHSAEQLTDRVECLIRWPAVLVLARARSDKSELLWLGFRRSLLRLRRRFYGTFVACP